MQKVCIIGCPGSGKSTFSRELHRITGLPLWHLDMLFWNADATSVERPIFQARLNEVLVTSQWIIDGNYGNTLPQRISACDSVFVFDLPAELCLAGVEARRGKVRPDIPWIEMREDPEFSAYIRSFSTQKLPGIMDLLSKYPHVNLTVFHSHQEADDYLLQLERALLK